MKKLEEEMKKLLQVCERTKDSQIKDENHLKSLSESIDLMSDKFHEYEEERPEKDKIIDSTKSDMVSMNEKI